MDFELLRKKYEDELITSVIPFWKDHCIDEEFGGFFTFLDRDGSAYDTDKYMWMQWRIVYEFATLYTTKYSKPEFLKIAENGYNFLYNNGRDENGSYFFALNRAGTPIIAPYNIYSEAFAVMGSAALYNATKNEKYKISAIQSMDNYLKRIDNPKGKWNKSLTDNKKRHSLGNYMILANLGMVIKDCLGIDLYEEHVSNAVKMVTERFWNDEFQVLFENINQDFSFDLDSCEGRHLNPGHGLEACWFLLQYAENSKNADNLSESERQELIEKISKIVLAQLKFGWDEDYGGIFYFMDVLDKPHLELQWDMKLWWVHNESLIATLYAYKLTQNPEFLNWFERIDEWTWKHFPDKSFGEWYGYLNRMGNPTHALKGGKWKTFFHLPRCLLMCSVLLDAINEK